jgi:hypothetical protein
MSIEHLILDRRELPLQNRHVYLPEFNLTPDYYDAVKNELIEIKVLSYPASPMRFDYWRKKIFSDYKRTGAKVKPLIFDLSEKGKRIVGEQAFEIISKLFSALNAVFPGNDDEALVENTVLDIKFPPEVDQLANSELPRFPDFHKMRFSELNTYIATEIADLALDSKGAQKIITTYCNREFTGKPLLLSKLPLNVRTTDHVNQSEFPGDRIEGKLFMVYNELMAAGTFKKQEELRIILREISRVKDGHESTFGSMQTLEMIAETLMKETGGSVGGVKYKLTRGGNIRVRLPMEVLAKLGINNTKFLMKTHHDDPETNDRLRIINERLEKKPEGPIPIRDYSPELAQYFENCIFEPNFQWKIAPGQLHSIGQTEHYLQAMLKNASRKQEEFRMTKVAKAISATKELYTLLALNCTLENKERMVKGFVNTNFFYNKNLKIGGCIFPPDQDTSGPFCFFGCASEIRNGAFNKIDRTNQSGTIAFVTKLASVHRSNLFEIDRMLGVTSNMVLASTFFKMNIETLIAATMLENSAHATNAADLFYYLLKNTGYSLGSRDVGAKLEELQIRRWTEATFLKKMQVDIIALTDAIPELYTKNIIPGQFLQGFGFTLQTRHQHSVLTWWKNFLTPDLLISPVRMMIKQTTTNMSYRDDYEKVPDTFMKHKEAGKDPAKFFDRDVDAIQIKEFTQTMFDEKGRLNNGVSCLIGSITALSSYTTLFYQKEVVQYAAGDYNFLQNHFPPKLYKTKWSNTDALETSYKKGSTKAVSVFRAQKTDQSPKLEPTGAPAYPGLMSQTVKRASLRKGVEIMSHRKISEINGKLVLEETPFKRPDFLPPEVLEVSYNTQFYIQNTIATLHIKRQISDMWKRIFSKMNQEARVLVGLADQIAKDLLTFNVSSNIHIGGAKKLLSFQRVMVMSIWTTVITEDASKHGERLMQEILIEAAIHAYKSDQITMGMLRVLIAACLSLYNRKVLVPSVVVDSMHTREKLLAENTNFQYTRDFENRKERNKYLINAIKANAYIKTFFGAEDEGKIGFETLLKNQSFSNLIGYALGVFSNLSTHTHSLVGNAAKTDGILIFGRDVHDAFHHSDDSLDKPKSPMPKIHELKMMDWGAYQKFLDELDKYHERNLKILVNMQNQIPSTLRDDMSQLQFGIMTNEVVILDNQYPAYYWTIFRMSDRVLLDRCTSVTPNFRKYGVSPNIGEMIQVIIAGAEDGRVDITSPMVKHLASAGATSETYSYCQALTQRTGLLIEGLNHSMPSELFYILLVNIHWITAYDYLVHTSYAARPPQIGGMIFASTGMFLRDGMLANLLRMMTMPQQRATISALIRGKTFDEKKLERALLNDGDWIPGDLNTLRDDFRQIGIAMRDFVIKLTLAKEINDITGELKVITGKEGKLADIRDELIVELGVLPIIQPDNIQCAALNRVKYELSSEDKKIPHRQYRIRQVGYMQSMVNFMGEEGKIEEIWTNLAHIAFQDSDDFQLFSHIYDAPIRRYNNLILTLTNLDVVEREYVDTYMNIRKDEAVYPHWSQMAPHYAMEIELLDIKDPFDTVTSTLFPEVMNPSNKQITVLAQNLISRIKIPNDMFKKERLIEAASFLSQLLSSQFEDRIAKMPQGEDVYTARDTLNFRPGFGLSLTSSGTDIKKTDPITNEVVLRFQDLLIPLSYCVYNGLTEMEMSLNGEKQLINPQRMAQNYLNMSTTEVGVQGDHCNLYLLLMISKQLKFSYRVNHFGMLTGLACHLGGGDFVAIGYGPHCRKNGIFSFEGITSLYVIHNLKKSALREVFLYVKVLCYFMNHTTSLIFTKMQYSGPEQLPRILMKVNAYSTNYLKGITYGDYVVTQTGCPPMWDPVASPGKVAIYWETTIPGLWKDGILTKDSIICDKQVLRPWVFSHHTNIKVDNRIVSERLQWREFDVFLPVLTPCILDCLSAFMTKYLYFKLVQGLGKNRETILLLLWLAAGCNFTVTDFLKVLVNATDVETYDDIDEERLNYPITEGAIISWQVFRELATINSNMNGKGEQQCAVLRQIIESCNHSPLTEHPLFHVTLLETDHTFKKAVVSDKKHLPNYFSKPNPLTIFSLLAMEDQLHVSEHIIFKEVFRKKFYSLWYLGMDTPRSLREEVLILRSELLYIPPLADIDDQEVQEIFGEAVHDDEPEPNSEEFDSEDF